MIIKKLKNNKNILDLSNHFVLDEFSFMFTKFDRAAHHLARFNFVDDENDIKLIFYICF